jgi:hypothetical protein
MRHIGTLIAAVIIGPLAWILIAFGQTRSAAAFTNERSSGAFHTGDFVRPLIFLAGAGLVLGLIATLRFSPLGAGLTGAVYVLSYVWLLIDAKGLLDLFKRDLKIGSERAVPTLPIQTGTTLILGALLLVSVASVHRWRRWPRPAAAAAAEPPAGTPPTGPTPGGADLDSTTPFGLGPGDATMFRPGGAIRLGETEPATTDPTTSTLPATLPIQQSRIESSPYRRIGEPPPLPGSDEPTLGASRTPPGSPWATPLRDDPDQLGR